MTIVTINEKYRVNTDQWNHTLEQYSEGGSNNFTYPEAGVNVI